MRFAITIDLGRLAPDVDLAQAARESLELAKLADEGGFDIIFAPEHHAIQMTIGPNPFVQLAYWAPHVKRARLGPAVIAVPYWHPIRLAGEAALFDLLSGGRLELGLGRGAYQYEFDRMGAGIDADHARDMLTEMVPLLKQLWTGGCSHDALWAFPESVATPPPVQQPYPPLWIAARHPAVFDFAVREECDIMANPLAHGFDEVESLVQRLETAVANNADARRPRMMMLRNTCVYDDATQWEIPVNQLREFAARFLTLFDNSGGVPHGFPDRADIARLPNADEYEPKTAWKNHIFGTPDEVIEKLKPYEQAGIDYFLYATSPGLPPDMTRRSLELFVEHVIPAFATAKAPAHA